MHWLKSLLKTHWLFTIPFLFFSGLSLQSQSADMPRPSPKASVSQTIGVSEIAIHYSRPSARERKVFGGLIPFKKVWRTGANEATTIAFQHDAKFCGQDIQAGTYSLFTIPGEEKWTVILNREAHQFGAYNYDSNLDVLRAEVESTSAPFMEMFTIQFSEVSLNSGSIQLQWENTTVHLPISLDTDKLAVQAFETAMDEITEFWYTYSAAAHYYYQQKGDAEKAIEYLDKAIALEAPNPAPWMLKSQILAKQGQFEAAIEVAKQALKVSQTNEEFHFEVEENQAQIKKWQTLLKK